MIAVTPRQMEILATIFVLTRDHDGRPPTMAEISASLAMTTAAGCQTGINALVAKGMVLKDFHKVRSIRLTEEGIQALLSSSSK